MVKRILREVKEYKLVSILTPICMILEVVFETLIPFLMASMIDGGISTGNMQHVVKIGMLMLLVAILSLLTGIGGGAFGSKASAGFAKNLREAMYNHIQTFSFKNIDKFSTAGLVTRLTTDVTNVQNSYQMCLRMAMRAPFSMICALIMAFYINAKISCIYVVAIIFLTVCAFFLIKRATSTFRQAFPKYDKLNESVQENVSAIRVVKAFVREDKEIDKFKAASNGIYAIFKKAEYNVIVAGPTMMLTVNTCILLISWIGAKMIVAGNLSTGELTSLLAYCMNILMSLMMVSMVVVMITMSSASVERIYEVLVEEPDITNPENPVMNVKDGSIVFENVDFAYNSDSPEPVLKNINLSIKSGETIGIMGGTGSAKTSLVNLISRLYDVSSGAVKVGGIDVREYDIEVIRDSVSVVLQNNVLFTGSILDNLRWGNKEATLEQCREACKLACADDFIMSFPEGYDTQITQGGTNVSGGQKQRLCIARALLKQPKVLILDDSTSAVDTATDARIRKAFKEFLPETTKLIISQRISSIKDADKIIVMEDGKVAGFGTHEELLSNPIYSEIYEIQTSGGGDFDEKEEV